MESIETTVQRLLDLLDAKIKERGFEEVEVEQALGWDQLRISELMSKQESVRVEHVLSILDVLDVAPADFWAELYPESRALA